MSAAAPQFRFPGRDQVAQFARCAPVFPCDGDKRPRTQHGFHDASADESTVARWWDLWPQSLVGMPTGAPSGLVVLDIDPDSLTDTSRAWLEQHAELLLATRVHHTRRGGRHYVFYAPAGVQTRSCAAVAVDGQRLEGIDVRADGGYVIWWPAHGLPHEGEIQPLSEALYPLFVARRQGANGPTEQEPSTEGAEAIAAGRRNEYLSREAYRLRKQGASVEQIEPVLKALNAARCSPPLAEEELRQIAQGKAHIAPESIGAAASPANEPAWPEPLAEAAYQGLIGDIVRAIETQTEADPAAVLLQVLVAFGALVGRGPHVRVEGDEHHLNLFALLVGATSKARKGTSWGRVREIFSCVSGWPRVVNGLSSGEGLKYNVRDPITKMERDKRTGHMEEVLVDAGVDDKRLLVVESEFAQVLRQAARAGNTLSPTIRAAWDTGTLMTLTKNDPVTATGAHISIIGHITIDELRAELTATDSANGFANRFEFMCVKRSKILPFGGGPLAGDRLRTLAARITKAAERAKQLHAIGMTEDARQIWQRVYPTLSEGHLGLFGAVTARAEAQCLRLALAYALADKADAIGRHHLLAAIAIWERAEASARYIFGSALGDRVADEILRALKGAGPAGLTRTEISALFRRNETADRIGVALDLLVRRGLAERAHQQHHQGGRPAEVWRVR